MYAPQHGQQIWQECSRLITNCIIFYNATILSNIAEHRKAGEDTFDLQKISPVAWQHINLHGFYKFNKPGLPVDIEEITEILLSKLRKENTKG